MIEIGEEEYQKIKEIRSKNKNKRVEKLLEVLCLRHAGKSNKEITIATGYNTRYVTTLLEKYSKQGLEEFVRVKQTSHRRKLSEEEEDSILQVLENKAAEGHILTVSEVRDAFEKRLSEKTADNYIYRLLKRHNWRKVMPRSKHPKAASEEQQDSSKKLRLNMPK